MLEGHNLSTKDIIKKMDRWISSFSEESSKTICSLYDEKASLWGTLSPIKRDNSTLIKDYFDQLFIYQNRSVEINDSNIRFFGDMAICNGLYTFSWIKEGIKVATMARFSFVFIKYNKDWLIVEHHSSVIPKVA